MSVWIRGGQGTREGGFKANMTLRDRAGRIIWRESVVRPQGSRVMAFERLGDKLRAARGKNNRS